MRVSPPPKKWERTQVAQPRIRSVALNDPLRNVHRYIDHSPFGAFNVFLFFFGGIRRAKAVRPPCVAASLRISPERRIVE